jgi:hypothetical protein
MRSIVLGLLLVSGCGKPAGPQPSDPIEVTPAMYLADKTLSDVHDGDQISLEFPPQGGHVLFVGARAKGLSETLVTLRGRLRSAEDNSIFAEESRTVGFNPSPEDPTMWIPDLRSFSNVSNVPVCPSYTSYDLYNHTFVLEVTVTELTSMRTAMATRKVIPSCLQTVPGSLSYCQCDCAANYVLGKCGTPM